MAVKMLETRARIEPTETPWTRGVRDIPLVRVQRVMERYISPIMVASVLEAALKALGKSTTEPTTDDVVEHCMVGLRLFVAEEQLPQLMLELADILMDC